MIDGKKFVEDIYSHVELTDFQKVQIGKLYDKQPKTDWIPCEVKLPPKPRFSEDSYLVKTQCVTTPYTAYWNGEKWTDVLDEDIEDVIAWCPIPNYPQPYKKEGAENVSRYS